MREMEIKDNSFLRQFETKVNGHLAKIEYSSQERKVFLTKLVIPEEIKQEGFKEDFIKEVLQEQLEKGIQLGPQSDIAGEVAELICEFTGMERVTEGSAYPDGSGAVLSPFC